VAQLEVLVLIPAPSDAPAFDAERLWQDLARAAQPLVTRGALKIERLPACSENELRKRLAQAPCAVLHFIGTGSARAAAQYGTLIFEDSARRSRNVNANHLAALLKQHETLKLVVLQARQPGEDPLGAPAAALVSQGVPAAVSTPLIENESLATFVSEFYGALVSGATGAEAIRRTGDALAGRGRPAPTLKLHARDPQWRMKDSADRGASARVEAPAPSPPEPAAPSAPAISREEAERAAAAERATQAIARKRAAGEFDVFLCHNWADKPAVKKIAQQLIAAGVMPWLDEWELPPGRPWQPLLEQQIASIRSAAVFVGAAGIGPWQEQEINGLLRQFVRRANPVIPVLLYNAPEKPELPLFLEAMTWVDFRLSDPDPLERLMWGITGTRANGFR
jgi:hypothetical protein